MGSQQSTVSPDRPKASQTSRAGLLAQRRRSFSRPSGRTWHNYLRTSGQGINPTSKQPSTLSIHPPSPAGTPSSAEGCLRRKGKHQERSSAPFPELRYRNRCDLRIMEMELGKEHSIFPHSLPFLGHWNWRCCPDDATTEFGWECKVKP